MSQTFDFIVVGSGSAGGALAARLSESGKYKVALLEAGTRDERYLWSRAPLGVAFLIDDQKVNWCRYAEPNETLGGRQLFVPSGKTLGGSSSINGMIYNRGQQNDYNNWAQLGCTGWSFQDVLPFFKRLESTDIGEDEFRGRDGPIRVTETEKYSPFFDQFIAAAKAIGLPENPDYSGSHQYGITMAQHTVERGLRQSTATQYLRPARGRANFTIIQGAEATSLILEGSRCVGVRYRRGGAQHEARAGREVILSTGAIGSPKLLELSGIGNAEVLARNGIAVAHELKGVGENLRDHYGSTLEWKFGRPGLSVAPKGRGWRLGVEAARYALTRRGFLSQGWATMRVFGRSHPGVEDADLVLMANPYLVQMRGTKRSMSRTEGFFIYAQVQRPESCGSIHIKTSDALADPAIRYNVLATEQDQRTAIAGVRLARRIAAADPLASVIAAELKPGKDVETDDEILAYARATGGTTFHPVGTCKMGTDAMAVVDQRLRVHGIAGLRVADTSIMPTIISGNTSIPAMMIGERCADMIIGDNS